MSISNDIQQNRNIHKEFWDSLQTEILTSNHSPTYEELIYFIEKNYIFSLFFRGMSHKEMTFFKSLFHMKDNAYLILLELFPAVKSNILDYDIEEYDFYRFLKNTLGPDTINAIGPIISNRISILVSVDSKIPEDQYLQSSQELTQRLLDAIHQKYQINASAGIGNVYLLYSIYASFIDALSCMHYCTTGHAVHVRKLEVMEPDYHNDYNEAQKHMLDAVRLRKPEAYDYFVIMMKSLQPLNDDLKRNKITEALILAAHASQLDNNKLDSYNYTSQISKLMELSGNSLIEWAYQRFMYITGFAKPQVSIDYTNKIVKATKEYLEAHYAEEISLEDVADQVNISPQYFSKLIKKNTGFNFIDWLSMLRVKKAKELLTNSNYTVKEVCFMVGYKDPNYFSRIFKKRIGITPSEYIKNRNQQ